MGRTVRTVHGFVPGECRVVAVTDAVAAATEGILVVGSDMRIERANDAAAAVLDRSADGLEGSDLQSVFPESVGPGISRLPPNDPPQAAVSFEEYYPTHEAWLSVRVVPLADEVGVYVRDVTELREREDRLEKRERELDTLDQINRVVGELVATIAAETDREQIERTVCERLASSPLFVCTWVVDPAPGDGRLRERASAGPTEGLIDELDGRQREPMGLEARAAADNEIVATQRLPEEPSVPESVRKGAFGAGIQSAIAVPIAYGETVYGVLGIYADRAEAFGDRERAGFETLGAITGVAINAAKQRRLLLSDTVTELSVRTTPTADPIAAAAASVGCELSGAGVVPVADAALVAFLVVEEGDPEVVLETATADDAIASEGRLVGDDADEALLSVRVERSSPLSTIVAHGGTVNDLHYADGTGRIVTDVQPAEATALADALTEGTEGVSIVAKRERDRDVETAGAFRTDVRDRLTDRQREAVTTAYMGGYYDWPRKSTAEDLATTLEVSSPTFHYHLRAAHRKLVDVFMEDGSGTNPDRRIEDVSR